MLTIMATDDSNNHDGDAREEERQRLLLKGWHPGGMYESEDPRRPAVEKVGGGGRSDRTSNQFVGRGCWRMIGWLDYSGSGS